MRKLLENLSWAIFDDFLFINSDYYSYLKNNPSQELVHLPRSFHEFDVKWYNWSQNKQSRNFKQKLENLRNEIFDHCREPKLKYDEKYRITKGDITAELKKNMSYPLYIALAGIEIESTEFEEVKDFLHPYQLDALKPVMYHNLEKILKVLKGGRSLGKLDKKFLWDIVEKNVIEDGNKFIVPPFPSNRNITDYIDAIWGNRVKNKLSKFYSQYSIFVHSYIHSWQVYPFSSVLEFKILNNEVEEFFSTVTRLLETYLEDCHNMDPKAITRNRIRKLIASFLGGGEFTLNQINARITSALAQGLLPRKEVRDTQKGLKNIISSTESPEDLKNRAEQLKQTIDSIINSSS